MHPAQELWSYTTEESQQQKKIRVSCLDKSSAYLGPPTYYYPSQG